MDNQKIYRVKWIITTVLLAIIFLFFGAVSRVVNAQVDGETAPIYIVNPGDTLWGISHTFNIPLDDLAERNGISDPSQLNVGSRLVIPGYEGLEGILVIETVPFGENLNSLSRRYKIPTEDLIRLNRWTTPDETAAGSTLITLEREEGQKGDFEQRTTLRSGKSVFEMAIIKNTNRWRVYRENNLYGVRDMLPGEIYFLPGEVDHGPGALPEVVESVIFDPPNLVQGKTLKMTVTAREELSLEGKIVDYELSFFPHLEGFVALQGIHAMLKPGYYPATLSGIMIDGTRFDFSQQVYIQDGGYPLETIPGVDSETIDVENTKPEDLEWFAVVEPVGETRFWSGVFKAPVPNPWNECFTSFFGNRRSYNGSAFNYFHTGLDFCGGKGVEIYAPAAGRVVFADSLIVRGNATVIDHGWGVYTAYAHQSEILVEEGDFVERGQLIGLIGSTGRITGPHLHWEVIVGGIQVDPMDWLQTEFP